MTPEEMKIRNAAVRDCMRIAPLYASVIAQLLIPETEAERLALECPATDKVDVIAWMLDRRDDEKPVLDAEWFANAEAVNPTPEYVHGPEVPGTTTWPEGTEYEWKRPDGKWLRGLAPYRADLELPRRRVYRIGQTYEHNGSNVCPLADGDQMIMYGKSLEYGPVPSGRLNWTSITHFTPVKEG